MEKIMKNEDIVFIMLNELLKKETLDGIQKIRNFSPKKFQNFISHFYSINFMIFLDGLQNLLKMSRRNRIEYEKKERKVLDCIHGFISFNELIWKFIDSPHFQRLRHIKQLGTLSWIYPGAVHSRFEHSLGTGYLAQKYIRTIIENHQNKPDVNKRVTKAYKDLCNREQAEFTVTLAGILHDIGHGPFSHLFDQVVERNKNNQEGVQGWSHEVAGLKIIDLLYKYVNQKMEEKQDSPQKYGYSQGFDLMKTKDRVKAFIIGQIQNNDRISFNSTFQKELETRPWQFQIVSNRLTGIDVDKLDYFRRDSYYLGAKNIFIEHDLLMKETFVLINKQYSDISEKHRLCFPSKYSNHVFDIFYSRYKLHKTYYSYYKNSGNDLLIKDILASARNSFELNEKCQELIQSDISTLQKGQYMTEYLYLNDSILNYIQYSNDQNFEEAKELVDRLQTRNNYDFVCEYHQYYPTQQDKKFKKDKKKFEKNTINIQDIENSEKTIPDFYLQIRTLNFGIKDKNPFEECKFYDKSRSKYSIRDENFENFQSMISQKGTVQLSIRLYATNKEQSQENREIKKKQVLNNFRPNIYGGQTGTYANRQPKKKVKRDR